MQLDKLCVAVRPMNTMQAIDLGFVLARRWFVSLWKLWIMMALPAFVVCIILVMLIDGYLLSTNAELLYGDIVWHAFAGSFVFWWLKPLYEKPLLDWLGQAVFGVEQPLKAVVKRHHRSYFQHGKRLLFASRLSTIRPLWLSVCLLEYGADMSANSKNQKNRINLLNRGNHNLLLLFTLMMLALEMSFAVNIGELLNQLLKSNPILAFNFSDYTKISELVYLIQLFSAGVVYFILISCIAPFFVCGGFAIYLTKRCLLEGWDIELVFKNLAQRYQEQQDTPIHKLNNQLKHSRHSNAKNRQNSNSQHIDNIRTTDSVNQQTMNMHSLQQQSSQHAQALNPSNEHNEINEMTSPTKQSIQPTTNVLTDLLKKE